MIGNLLFELLGSLTLSNSYDDMQYSIYKNEKFIVIVHHHKGRRLVSVDLNSAFNKESQMPIHFIVNRHDISSRRKKRIIAGINHLLSNEKDAGSFFGQMDGYDDLGIWVRDGFYSQKSL